MNIGGVIINDFSQYKSNSNLIVRLIKKTYPNEKIIYEEPNKIDLYCVQIGTNIKITIMPGDTWTEIKKNIDLKLYDSNQLDDI